MAGLLMLVFILELSASVLLCCLISRTTIVIAKATFDSKKTLFASKLDLNLRKKVVKRHPCSIDFYGAKTSTSRKVDRKHLERFEMWCWRGVEKISWTNDVRNEEVLQRVKVERNILHTIQRRKANWIGYILRRNCFLEHVIEGKWKGQKDEEEEVSSYLMTLRKREETGA